MADEGDYGLGAVASASTVPAPDLPYRPRNPKSYRPNIALIGCGGITEQHLKAYRAAGYNVVAFCDVNEERARKRLEFYPEAKVYTDPRQVLTRDNIDVVDVATHPHVRVAIVEEALRARKHVLSQKPFVLDLDTGRRLVDLADAQGVKLAVNQNGRWAPHFAYIRETIGAGLIGDVLSVRMSVHWDHNWIKGTEFENVRHVVLYDFAIHWFDILACFMRGREAARVYASMTRSSGQQVRPALLAQAAVEYDGAQASLGFDADTRFGQQDRTYVVGSLGTITSIGNDLNRQDVTLYTKAGCARPVLQGAWFPDGFHGTMGELLCAIEEGREPANSARDNLRGLALCFAAVASAEAGVPRRPGEVRTLAG
jgi:predicted dehydrogenase